MCNCRLSTFAALCDPALYKYTDSNNNMSGVLSRTKEIKTSDALWVHMEPYGGK